MIICHSKYEDKVAKVVYKDYTKLIISDGEHTIIVEDYIKDYIKDYDKLLELLDE